MARLGIGPLLLAGAAAFGYYKYSKMTSAEKEQLKRKGMKFYEENVPQNLRDMIAGKQQGGHTQQTAGTTTGGNYTNGTEGGYSQM